MVVTGRLALLTGLGVVPVVALAVLGVDPWLTVLGWVVLVAGAATADAAAAGDPRRVRVGRPDDGARARLGDPVLTRVRLANDGGRRIRGLLRDAWQPTAGAPATRIPMDLPAGERREYAVPLLPRRRGELVSAAVVVRSMGPVGLAGRQASLASRGAVRVLPPFTTRRHLPSRLARLKELDGSTSVQVRGPGTEFDSLREYVRGDDVRSIDWRATARSTSVMLRTWRPERDRHVVIVVDTGRTSAARVGDGVRLDAAMEASLLLAALAQRAGDHVHLVMVDRLVRARVTRVDGPGLLPAMVDAMAGVEPTLIDTDWDVAFAQARRLTSRPSLVVLLTAQDAPESSRGFLAALPMLARGTQVIVATADERATRAHADDPAADPAADEVYLEAAEARSARDGARVAAAIARAGADAVTGSADDLPPKVADRYLALKAAGRL